MHEIPCHQIIHAVDCCNGDVQGIFRRLFGNGILLNQTFSQVDCLGCNVEKIAVNQRLLTFCNRIRIA